MKNDLLQGIIFKSEPKTLNKTQAKGQGRVVNLIDDIKRQYIAGRKLRALKKYKPMYRLDLLDSAEVTSKGLPKQPRRFL